MSMFDQRSTAFLEEMGVGPLWLLRSAPAPEQAPAPAQEPARAPASAPVQAPASAESAPAISDADAAIAAMDWDQLQAAIAACTRCSICKGKKPVYGEGARQAAWLVAAGACSALDQEEGTPMAGDAGRLLANMLGAVGLSRERDVYVTSLIKCRPTSANGGDRAPSAEEARACRPYLERELALTGAGTVLTLGQIAANALQDKPLQEPLAQSRGQVHAFQGARLVATLHPGELLRRGADKALAWADLCLAKSSDGRPG
jgi:uracil-DNA glycosylase